MKIFAYALMMCWYAASSANGADSWEMNRDRLIICSQFVIEDPDPGMIRSATPDCCRIARRIRDCRVGEWDES